MGIILIRGLPGSGKSTLAKKIQTDFGHTVCEANDYFTIHNKPNEYFFSAKELKYAHQYCLLKVRHELYHGNNVVVVNTFVKKWEMKPYFDLAEEFEVNIEVICATFEGKTIHDVPEWKIQNMKENWEE